MGRSQSHHRRYGEPRKWDLITYDRDFAASSSYQVIAEKLLADEEHIFAMLYIEAEA